MDKLFYKFKTINEFTLESLKEHYFYFSDKDELNDPFDIKIPTDYSATDQEIIDWGIRTHTNKDFIKQVLSDRSIIQQPKFIDSMDKKNEELLKRFRVFCITEIWNEELMWGHYADSFKGVCFGYNTYFSNGAYLLKLDNNVNTGFNFSDNGNNIMVLLDVKYEKNILKPYNIFKHNVEVVQEGFKYKRPKWIYEKEYRALYMDMTKSGDMKKIVYSKDILAEVIFGSRTRKEDILAIKEILKKEYNNKIKTFQIKIPDDSLDILRKEI